MKRVIELYNQREVLKQYLYEICNNELERYGFTPLTMDVMKKDILDRIDENKQELLTEIEKQINLLKGE